MPSKETEGVYRTAHKLSFQLNPVEDGLADSSFRTHRVGQALTGPKKLSRADRKLSRLGELVSMTQHKRHKQATLPKESGGPCEQAGYSREILYKL